MKTVSVHPLTRVEGHGRVDLMLRAGSLADARVAIIESPRLFEGLILGRDCREVPALVCRICAICSAVHRVASCQAMEKALGLEIPPLAATIRELLVLGGHIESHALHLFCLVLPDIEGEASILDLLRSGNDNARQGLDLKKLGNSIQEIAGGRAIHPVNVEVGGVVVRPERPDLEGLLLQLEEWQKRFEELQKDFFRSDAFPSAKSIGATRIAVGRPDELSLTGESLFLSDGRSVPVEDYRNVLAEKPVAYSNALHCRDGSTPFLAGALSRLELSGEGRSLLSGAGELPAGIHANNAAQCLELSWALKRCIKLIEEILQADDSEPLQARVVPAAGSGTAAVEAPRGLLVHHYVLDDLGRVVRADVITPTAINQAGM
ncbi:MAG: nickel-dependent hydrogenase large subunit, partial [Desulfuromonadales bacterium]